MKTLMTVLMFFGLSVAAHANDKEIDVQNTTKMDNKRIQSYAEIVKSMGVKEPMIAKQENENVVFQSIKNKNQCTVKLHNNQIVGINCK